MRTYSGGMQRRLDIGIGLVHRPSVLFLDEPTTGLDPEVRAAMWGEISRLADDGLTILLTTHYLEEADRLAGRIAIMERGRVVAEGTPDALKRELRGDALQLELTEPMVDGTVARALEPILGVREVIVDGRAVRARADDGARAVPAVLQALEAAASASRPCGSPGRRSMTSTCAIRGARSPTRSARRPPRRPSPRPADPITPHPSPDRSRSMTPLTHTWQIAVRHGRELLRQPWYIAFTLISPIVYLVLFGALFERVVEIPGFGSTSYLTYLTPGIVVMSALYAGGWTGMGVIEDLNAGVTDRFLVSPIWRGALIGGRLVQLAVTIIIQTAIIVVLGTILGAEFLGGLPGILVMTAAAILLGCAVGALSSALALVVRQEESIIGASQFVILPMTFLSTLFMAQLLLPAWMQSVAGFNPANWAAESARAALASVPDWSVVLVRLGWLLALTLACWWLANRAFRSYQRSI